MSLDKTAQQPLNNEFFGIGIFGCKTNYNLGTLWRSAYCFGASYIFLINCKFQVQTSDTTHTHSKIPIFEYSSFEDFYSHLPYGVQLVGIEIAENTEDIYNFEHPKRCCYLLGAEDNGLPSKVLNKCHKVIKIDTKACLNVSVTGSIVMYDRKLKQNMKI